MGTIQMIQFTPQQLQEVIGQAVSRQLEPFLNKLSEKEESDLLTKKEAAAFLSITQTTLDAWSKKGSFNSYGIGGRVYFKKSEIISALIKLN